MKHQLLISLLALALFSATSIQAQKPSIAIINIDANGFSLSPEQISNLTRVELQKIGIYEVIHQHDIAYVLKEQSIDPNECFSTSCLLNVGEKLSAGLVLSGSIEKLGSQIVINYRLIDVNKKQTVKTGIQEFLDFPEQMPDMIRLALLKMFRQPLDQDLFKKLTKKDDYESAVNVENTDRLELSGPRLGLTVFTGDVATLYKMDKEYGGFEASSVMFQFGYQFEVQYLNTGRFQGLFEFIPIVTGLDQGLFIPSVSILNGLRSTKAGWEFAFGPVFSVVKMREGRLHSDGTPSWNTGFVFGAGKTFRSGRMNFPVNAFFIPGKSGHRYGLSVGFNMASR